MVENKEPNRYAKILEVIFSKHFKKGAAEIEFERAEFSQAADKLGIALPKNLGDVLYSFRYRALLPKSITSKAPRGHEWIIRPAGKGKYKLVAVKQANIFPSHVLAETKIPDATPGVIAKYSMNDEQSLLAKLRYNRLVDIFTGLTCYSLQNHLRTTLRDGSQIETDEIYIGLDKRGAHYVLPVQAKGGRDRIGVVQIEQDIEMCALKFPRLICRAIAAQFMEDNLIALFEFEESKEGIKVASEKHYRLVKPDELSPEELQSYSTRQS
ncbi:MAG: endonuclease [Chloroflexota bacterium]|nr:endonuclease [Chloroflexota bacterium]MBI5702074.1 endonuclease [Chloroflexota bacterium]